MKTTNADAGSADKLGQANAPVATSKTRKKQATSTGTNNADKEGAGTQVQGNELKGTDGPENTYPLCNGEKNNPTQRGEKDDLGTKDFVSDLMNLDPTCLREE
ncbi:hypothetical protein, partial [Acinetobacter baumannii]|uniref:hypothetical protein n=1 Tax=Acinetobacter baumannii TaxID=470 RepID=UPI001C06E56E